MAKKKKQKKTEQHHADHHQAIHEYIVKQIEREDTIPQIHHVPLQQPWHVPNTMCFCRPKLVSENVYNGVQIYQHSNIIH